MSGIWEDNDRVQLEEPMSLAQIFADILGEAEAA